MGSFRPDQDLKKILAEVEKLNAEPDRFKKMHNDFALRTTNEIDELFAKVDKRPTAPGNKQARSGKMVIRLKWLCHITSNHGNDVTLQDKRG